MILLTWQQIFYALCLVLLCAVLAYFLRLPIIKSILIASFRSIVQLSLIGNVLAWVFAQEHWFYVFTTTTAMTLIAAHAATNRAKKVYKKLLLDVSIVLFLAGFLATFIALIIIQKSPTLTASIVIPLLGMILGNALTAISLVATTLIEGLKDNQKRIFAMLALSASPKEATHDLLKKSITQGLTPTLNSMTVVGLVSLPGMMTGQILAGADPTGAVRYQIVILFFIFVGAFMACVCIAHLILRRFFNERAQLILPSSMQ